MRFVVHKFLFNTEHHYLYDANVGTGQFVHDIPSDTWIIGCDHDVQSINMFAQLIHKDFTAIPALQQKIFTSLGVEKQIPWHLTMPKEQFKAHLKHTLDVACDILKSEYRNYYETIFITSRRFLEALNGICVDRHRLIRYLNEEQNRSIISALTSCIPNEDGVTQPIQYDFVSSKTGRFKVRSGPRVLTLKRKYRDIFASEWSNGRIVPLDYKSLEARIALAIGGQIDIAQDPYQKIAIQTGVDRSVAKIAMLSIMFGSSIQRIMRTTKLTQAEAVLLITHIKDAIQYDAIVAQLQTEYANNMCIHNFYGRPLWPGTDAGHVLYNNYIQSTGVDVAMLGFSKMAQYIKQKELLIRPKFVVHDCLYIDVHSEYDSNIKELQSIGSSIPNLNAYFYSSIQ